MTKGSASGGDFGEGICRVSEALLGIRLKRQTVRNTDTFETILRHDIHYCFTKERQLFQNLLLAYYA